jgi:hypothetical protein
MAGPFPCQHPKMTKSTFLEKGPETGALRPFGTGFSGAAQGK